MAEQKWTNVADLPVPPIMSDNTSYTGGIAAYIPKVLHRVLSTPSDVVAAAHEGMSLHHVTIDEAAASAGVSRDVASDVIEHGKGTVGHVIDVLGAVGIDAVTMPSPTSLAKGV